MAGHPLNDDQLRVVIVRVGCQVPGPDGIGIFVKVAPRDSQASVIIGSRAIVVDAAERYPSASENSAHIY